MYFYTHYTHVCRAKPIFSALFFDFLGAAESPFLYSYTRLGLFLQPPCCQQTPFIRARAFFLVPHFRILLSFFSNIKILNQIKKFFRNYAVCLWGLTRHPAAYKKKRSVILELGNAYEDGKIIYLYNGKNKRRTELSQTR